MDASAASRRGFSRLLAALALAAAGGCGFKLRGSAELPFETLYSGFAPSSPVGAEFRSMVRVAGNTKLVDRPEDAEARLEILQENREKEIVAFSSTGAPREYQIRLRLRFRVVDRAGKEKLAPTELLVRRELTSTSTQVLSKEQEEEIMYREMQSDLVQQLLRRLAAIPR